MIAVDTNLLVYAHRRATPEHAAAAAVLQGLVDGSRDWALPWPCCYEFFGVATNRRLWKEEATSAEDAWRQLNNWIRTPVCRLLGETEEFLNVLEGFLVRPGVHGSRVHDARIAALCCTHGVDSLWTRDRDFSLFPELRTHNPLRDKLLR